MGRRPADRTRAPVSRQRAFIVALAVADSEGIEAVTMRRLARELGVEAASLYHHVKGKEEILDELVNLVSAEIPAPVTAAGWRAVTCERACNTRAVLLRHPWAVSLMASRTTPGPATLRHLEAGIRPFREAGFSVPMAAHAISVVDSYIHGFVLQEVNLPFHDESELAAMTGAIMDHFPAEDFPHLFQLTVEHVLRPGYEYGNEFSFGLEVLLDGLQAALDR
ncbi:MAG TPA: TetR/AcrR family transcriptional regulator [Jatrophihabitans sp.]|jgi:AcrR family transcriptional regulator